MTAITGNFGLTKPDKEDFYDIEVQNENMEVIDQKLKELKTGVDQVQDALESHVGDTGIHGSEARFSSILNALSVQQRNILKLKMRETGVYLDVNAWSDSLNDVSGLNPSCYSYNWTNKYEMNVDPTTQGWMKTVVSGSIAVSGGMLRINKTGTGECTLKFSNPCSTTDFFAVKTRVKVASSGNSTQSISICDGVKRIAVDLYTTGVGGYSKTMSDGYHDVLVKKFAQTKYEVWLDGALIITSTNFFNDTYALLILGDTSGSTYLNDASYEYIYTTKTQFDGADSINGAGWSYVNGNIKSTTGGTVIWNPVSSEGELNKVIIESEAVWGTGTIKYYFSRNGGATFSQCMLGTITDISAQPSGTSIVVKAVLTGNAELQALAWGGSTI